MPKKLLATTITIALVVTMLSVIPISKANFYPIPSMQIMGHNPSYPNGNNYTFTVDVHISMDAPAIVSISYTLDDKENISSSNLEYTTWRKDNGPNNHQIYSLKQNLYNLEIGNHTINAYATDSKGKVLSNSRQFEVGNSIISNSTTPTSSQSMPTINTGSKLPLELNPSIVYILAIVIAIIAVALVSLLYFRRRKGKP